ncbi:MAG: hypothetical protein M3Y91_10890, partial [Actinomycetota bacterium]|nr:hypothetical protein [Actinomycetota bacterium]
MRSLRSGVLGGGPLQRGRGEGTETAKPDPGRVLTLPGVELTFAPSDPARSSTFVAYWPDGDPVAGWTGTVDVVRPHTSGPGVRRRRLPAVHLPVAETVVALGGIEPEGPATASA